MKRLFKNATIIDGSGAPAFQGYVITEKDKIEAVSCGKAPEGFDGEAYDCMGLTVAPGFIDAHSHNDWFAARQNPLPFSSPLQSKASPHRLLATADSPRLAMILAPLTRTCLEAAYFR